MPEVFIKNFFRFYKKYISIFFGNSCRFHPTCSAYAEEAILKHGFFKGGFFSFVRICKCSPWSKGGIDEVP